MEKPNNTFDEQPISKASTYSIESLGKETQFKFDKSCRICGRAFTILLSRHHCRQCGHSVCKEHSQKQRQTKSGKARICDLCEIEFVQNAINEALHAENKLIQEKIERFEEMMQLKNQEIEKQESQIKAVENKIKFLENSNLEKESSIRKLFQEEQLKHEHTRNVAENLRIALDQSQKGEVITQDFMQRDVKQTLQNRT